MGLIFAHSLRAFPFILFCRIPIILIINIIIRFEAHTIKPQKLFVMIGVRVKCNKWSFNGNFVAAKLLWSFGIFMFLYTAHTLIQLKLELFVAKCTLYSNRCIDFFTYFQQTLYISLTSQFFSFCIIYFRIIHYEFFSICIIICLRTMNRLQEVCRSYKKR